jgi:hypothetical protein
MKVSISSVNKVVQVVDILTRYLVRPELRAGEAGEGS